MTGFEKLDVWQESCRLSVDVYGALKDCRDYGLKDQMTRAAVSIASNIAEGAERKTDKEFSTFLYIAKGSAAELRTQLYIAVRLGIIPPAQASTLIDAAKKISGMLQKLISSLNVERPKSNV